MSAIPTLSEKIKTKRYKTASLCASCKEKILPGTLKVKVQKSGMHVICARNWLKLEIERLNAILTGLLAS